MDKNRKRPATDARRDDVLATGHASTAASELNRDEIARRAYDKWQARGCPPGDGAHDWFEAENELRQQQARLQASGKSAGRNAKRAQ
jgi:hypothetical protein